MVKVATARRLARQKLAEQVRIYGPLPSTGVRGFDVPVVVLDADGKGDFANPVMLSEVVPAVDPVLLYDRFAEACACGAPHAAHVGRTNAGGCEATGCGRYHVDLVEELLAEAARHRDDGFAADLRRHDAEERAKRPRPKRKTLSVRPTDLGGCDREVYYRNLQQLAEMLGGEHAETWERFVRAPEDKRAALLGVMIHDAWQAIQRKLYPWREHEIELTIPGLENSGRPDDYDPLTGRLRQCKTAGAYRWEMTYSVGVAEHWLDTEALYAFVLERDYGYDIVDIAFTIIERADGADVTFVFPWDEGMRARGRAALARLVTLKTTLTRGVVPARTRTGPSSDPLCRGCFARGECWQIPAADRYGISPESYIRVGPPPHPDATPEETAAYHAAMAEVLADVEATQEAAAETRRQVKRAQAAVAGQPIGRYGAYEISRGRRGNPDYKTIAEDLKDQFREATGREPIVIDRRQNDTKPSVRRVSAAQLAKEAAAAAERPDPAVPTGVAS